MKISLWRLAIGEVFKFDADSDEYALVRFDPRDMDELPHRRIAEIKNLRTGRISQTQVFFSVHIPPYNFVRQLTLF